MHHFHPLVVRWFGETFGEPTPAQQQGWQAIGSGRHTLIAAPTGSGKTLAAFLTALDGLFQEGLRTPLTDEVRVRFPIRAKLVVDDAIEINPQGGQTPASLTDQIRQRLEILLEQSGKDSKILGGFA